LPLSTLQSGGRPAWHCSALTSKVHVARSFQLAVVCPKHCSFEYFHRPDDGGSRHLWNIGLLQRDYTALYASSCDLLSTNLTKIFSFEQLPMSLIFAKWLIHRQTAKCIYNILFFFFFVSNQPTQTHVCRRTDCPTNIKLKPNHKLRPCTVSDILLTLSVDNSIDELHFWTCTGLHENSEFLRDSCFYSPRTKL
jgi:hypothetical protein